LGSVKALATSSSGALSWLDVEVKNDPSGRPKAVLYRGALDRLNAKTPDNCGTVAWALGIAIVLRTFLFQPFHIPSGSMLPGLMKGDYIITTKYSLGYGKYAATPLPFPIKNGRLLPGDQMQMQSGQLYINGERVKSEIVAEETYVNQYGNDAIAEAWRETFANGNSHIVLHCALWSLFYDG